MEPWNVHPSNAAIGPGSVPFSQAWTTPRASVAIFMNPDDVRIYVRALEQEAGFRHLENGECVDIAANGHQVAVLSRGFVWRVSKELVDGARVDGGQPLARDDNG